ncbi:signal recognition particle protein [Athalassotoga saccharophila]|uniref:signal recognition particle protein n=1 Tax=Athalassotoga saccharophila TaxID=1441386 RepID=UPI00137B92F9|nr:signal recognition particle protein [Athalassotoga saccharophila]BBJ27887.1 signal recognition particle protein [Athalassotoga saccharophila]
MFESLQSKLSEAFKILRGKGKITEKNIQDAVKQVKMSLLEADVNYKVVKELTDRISQRAIGEKVIQNISPDQQFIKIVNDELLKLFGETASLDLHSRPAVILIVGLQGSGKTTSAAKLALWLKKKNGRNPLLVADDVHRPAAIDQLEALGKSVDIPVFYGDRKDPYKIARESLDFAVKKGCDVVIVDTAGRLQIDEEMMKEAEEIAKVVKPDEVLMVLDSMAGQDVVNAAVEFDKRLSVTGFIITKLDGDARGGIALSTKYVTGKPIKFSSTGEKLDQFDLFYPDRIVSRILGMGDIVSLVEKVQQGLDKKKMEEMEKRLKKAQFTFDDFLDQIHQIKKMGSLSSILEMIPGAQNVKDLKIDDEQVKHVEAIINSMTKKERSNPEIINFSRKERIAKGSGRPLSEVNKLMKNYEDMKKMLKKFNKIDKLGKFPFQMK